VFAAGDVISYLEMCQQEGVNLQQGMNFRLRGGRSVILMSLRPGAPYADEVREEGRVLVYEGHDRPRTRSGPDPKTVDQELRTPAGSLTQNGLFYEAARTVQEASGKAELVHVYEKVRSGIWVYNGLFRLVDAWAEQANGRRVFKFRLELVAEEPSAQSNAPAELALTRVIPTPVKLEVWKRDKGRCVECGSVDNLHFDHVIPWSRGGSSLVAENIQLLCARHNLAKHDRIV
jgi:hypothetical protein